MTQESSHIVRARILVGGRVQGVAYRAFARREATTRGLTGGVRNLEDGQVEVDVEGPRSDVETYIMALRKGPPLAQVTDTQVQWEPTVARYADFVIWY
jgi:acylphosphatase